MEDNNYYVYEVRMDKKIVYIGKGKKSRYRHPTSGRSHVREFNELFYKGEIDRLAVNIIQKDMKEIEALEVEKSLIYKLCPKYNRATSRSTAKYVPAHPRPAEMNANKELLNIIKKYTKNRRSFSFKTMRDIVKKGEMSVSDDEIKTYFYCLGYDELQQRFTENDVWINTRADFRLAKPKK